MISLLVVTASVALGGCAADVDPEPALEQEQGIGLAEYILRDRLADARLIPSRSDMVTTDADRVRQLATYEDVTAAPPLIDLSRPSFRANRPGLDPRLDVYRPGFARVRAPLEAVELVDLGYAQSR